MSSVFSITVITPLGCNSYKTIYLENGKAIEDHSVQVLISIGEEQSQHQVLERASEDLVSACYDSVFQSQRAVGDKSLSGVVEWVLLPLLIMPV